MNSQIDPCKQLRLAHLVILLSFLFLFCVTFVPIPSTGEDNAKYIVGFLVGTGLTTIISFYFKRIGQVPDDTKPPEPEVKP